MIKKVTTFGPHARVVQAGLALLAFLASVVFLAGVFGQAGRKLNPLSDHPSQLSIVATHADEDSGPITAKRIALYDNGIEQTIQSFSPDPSPARIVLLVDNSLTIRADVKKLEDAAREFAYEIYEGDKLLIVGYDEQAEIVTDWTDNAKQVTASLKTFRKKGQPHLFDALAAVVEEALRPLGAGNQKRAIVVISDGLDRGSKTRFSKALATLQAQDIAVYSIQAPDRTGGALRRDQPKPVQVIQQLVEGTGGLLFPIKESKEAAKAICDELRKNRYLLSYAPSNVPYGDSRRLLVVADPGVNVRFKTRQPAN